MSARRQSKHLTLSPRRLGYKASRGRRPKLTGLARPAGLPVVRDDGSVSCDESKENQSGQDIHPTKSAALLPPIDDHDPQIANVGVRRAGFDQAAERPEKMIGVVAAKKVGGR